MKQYTSIRVAEAAKVIENSQRDINIAFMNELAIIFDKMELDTAEVLEAAGTKWNFLNFKPGLVGGHCTGDDPYYLTYQAEKFGHHPEVILAGRRINDAWASTSLSRPITKWDQLPKADAIVLAVAHREYLAMPIEKLTVSLQSGGCVIDVKSVLSRGEIVSMGFAVWRL